MLDIWMIQQQQAGPVQHAIDFFADAVAAAFAPQPSKKVR